MAVTNGPSSGNASLTFPPASPLSVEVEVPTGLPSLGPAQAAYVDPGAATYNQVPPNSGAASLVTSSTNTKVNFAALGTNIQVSIPA